MRYHLLALVPIILGSVGQLMGMQNAFLLGAMGTGIGIVISYVEMFSHAFGWPKVCAALAMFTLIVAGGMNMVSQAGDAPPRTDIGNDA